MAKPFTSIPGPRALPLIGTVLDYSIFGKHSFEKMHLAKQEKYKRFGRIYREKIGPVNLIQLFDPADFAKVFRAEGRCSNRPPIPISVVAHKRDGFPLGLGAMVGEDWRRYRMSVQKQMMHPKAASVYLPAKNLVVDDFVNLLQKVRDKDGYIDDLHKVLLRLTVESNILLCFNKRLGCLEVNIPVDSDAYDMTKATFDVFQAVQKTTFAFPWYMLFRTKYYRQFYYGYKECSRISKKYIGDAWKVAMNRGTDDEDPNLLHSLIAVERLTVEEIDGILIDLFRAGIDSMAGSLCFLLFHLARHVDKQEVLYNEIQKTLNGEQRQVTDDDINSMPYLKACLKESFRLNFPIEGGTTRILEQDLVLSGYKVPKGTIVALNNQTICLDEEYFDNPKQFVPERWLKDGSAILRQPPPFAMLPFGNGPRMCIGRRFAELVIYLATIKIVQTFRLTYEGPDIGMINRVFSQPDIPVKLRLQPR